MDGFSSAALGVAVGNFRRFSVSNPGGTRRSLNLTGELARSIGPIAFQSCRGSRDGFDMGRVMFELARCQAKLGATAAAGQAMLIMLRATLDGNSPTPRVAWNWPNAGRCTEPSRRSARRTFSFSCRCWMVGRYAKLCGYVSVFWSTVFCSKFDEFLMACWEICDNLAGDFCLHQDVVRASGGKLCSVWTSKLGRAPAFWCVVRLQDRWISRSCLVRWGEIWFVAFCCLVSTSIDTIETTVS